MIGYVTLGTNDLARALPFYDAVLGTLGVPAGVVDRHRVFWRTPTGNFSVTAGTNYVFQLGTYPFPAGVGAAARVRDV